MINKLRRTLAGQRKSGDPSRTSAARGFAIEAEPGPLAELGEAAEPAVLARAADLEAAGRLADAVDELADANRTSRDARVELKLQELRVAAGDAAVASPGAARSPWPPTYEDPFPEVVGRIPEVRAADLTTEVLGGAVAHHGSLIIRGLLDPAETKRAIEVIEHARAHQQARKLTLPDLGPHATEAQREIAAAAEAALPAIADDPTERDAWYRAVRAEPVSESNINRGFVAKRGGTWLGDSPTGSAHFLELLSDKGVIDVVTSHFGERPLISLQKSTMRRSHPIHKVVAWHQDGSFLADDVRTMNLWVAFTPCGGDIPSPGLEILPERVEEVLSFDGALTPHSIPEATIAELVSRTASVIPKFDAGDAIMFDEKLVHRTHLSAAMDQIRYALECWFFAPSHHTQNYKPLLV